jgi:hypothetical protein
MMRPLLIAAFVAEACSSGPDGPYDYAKSKGAALYQDQCQVCHGETGEGGLGPKLRDTKRSQGELDQIISQTMPQNNPGQCTGDCASALAEFITHGLTTSALSCDHVAPTTPRRLRLLTRREYRATVKDLFGDGAPAMTCARALDCTYRDTCVTGECEPTACNAQTFVFDAAGHTYHSVHVAGDFNHWPGTIAAGGLALAYQASTGLWIGTFPIGEGQHSYKLVLDEQTWIADPRAPQSAPDGFGGQNSVVALSCSGPQPLGDVSAAFPVETRSAGFPFDTDSDAALVTSAHIDAFLDTAQKIAAFAGTADIGTLGHRLFRRPLTADEMTRYGALDPKSAIAALLMSPNFLYRSELGESDGKGGFRLQPFEIATALAYTFTGTTPGDDLLAAAEHGELNSPAGVEKWARALVADPRSKDQIGEFAAQWTGAKGVLTVDKRADLFPDFDDAMRATLLAQTRDAGAAADTYQDLMTAGDDGRRAGMLGQPAVLATYAHSDQTAPVQRGLLVRRNFLCEELPPPPPFGGGLPAVDPNATTRQRFEMHSLAPTCRGCHVYIDGVGFGLEQFDPIGQLRTSENGQPIDSSGDIEDLEHLGSETSLAFASEPDLAKAIAGSQAGPACFVRQYLRFSRGLRETLAERCSRQTIQSKWTGDVRELMVQAVLAPDFVERR